MKHPRVAREFSDKEDNLTKMPTTTKKKKKRKDGGLVGY